MNIYISNLDQNVTDEELRNLFQQHGEVSSAEVVKDVFTDQSRGFGYVEMPDDTTARSAIVQLNNFQLNNRAISVTEAGPKPERKGSYMVGNGFHGGSLIRDKGIKKGKGYKRRF